MVAFLTGWFIIFGWLCFIGLSGVIVWWFDEHNYWMPTIYLLWGIIFFVVTYVVNFISVSLFG